jgi:hypothetical protein
VDSAPIENNRKEPKYPIYMHRISFMKLVAWCAFAISLWGAAVAVTITNYNDAGCSTPRSTSQASPNPWISAIGTCTKFQTVLVGQVTVDLFFKPTACASTSGSIQGKFSGVLYGDPGCTGRATQNADMIGDTDRCINTTLGGSQKVECAAGASAGLAFLVLASAVLALCV